MHNTMPYARLLPVVFPIILGTARHDFKILTIRRKAHKHFAGHDGVDVLVSVSHDKVVDADRNVRHNSFYITIAPHSTRCCILFFFLFLLHGAFSMRYISGLSLRLPRTRFHARSFCKSLDHTDRRQIPCLRFQCLSYRYRLR